MTQLFRGRAQTRRIMFYLLIQCYSHLVQMSLYFLEIRLCKPWEAAESPSSKRGPEYWPRPSFLISAEYPWQGLTSTLHWGWFLYGFFYSTRQGVGSALTFWGKPWKGGPDIPSSSTPGLLASCLFPPSSRLQWAGGSRAGLCATRLPAPWWGVFNLPPGLFNLRIPVNKQPLLTRWETTWGGLLQTKRSPLAFLRANS